MNIEQRYLHDNIFHRVVDQMRSLLSMYHITPSELREASILAAAMHESENIKPLYISYDEYGSGLHRQMLNYLIQSPSYPAMFGGKSEQWYSAEKWKPVLTCICAVKEEKIHTATCNHYNWEYWHPQVPGFNPHTFSIVKGDHRVCCHCGLSNVYISNEYHNFSSKPCKKS